MTEKKIATINKLLDSQKESITFEGGCVFCGLKGQPVGYKEDRGGILVYKTGYDPSKDWFALLQPSTLGSIEDSFRILFLPVGHISTFMEISKNPEFAQNYGIALPHVSTMMLIARYRLLKEDPNLIADQILSAKHMTPENTQYHLHFKLDFLSGGLAQSFPTDAGWLRKEKHGEKDKPYVKAEVVNKKRLSESRLEEIADKLIKIDHELRGIE